MPETKEKETRDLLSKEIEEPIKEEKPLEKPVYTKEQQMIDQERANTKKAKEEVQTYADALDEAQTELQGLKSQIEQQNRAVEKKSDELEELDPAYVDGKVIANFEKMQQRLATMETRYEDLSKKAQAYETQIKTTEQATIRNKKIEDIYSACDEEFGAKFRNAAIKLADKLVQDGEEGQPTDSFDGYKLMKKCYQRVAKEAEEKPSVVSDSGSSGGVLGKDTEKPVTGRLHDIKELLRKNPKIWS